MGKNYLFVMFAVICSLFVVVEDVHAFSFFGVSGDDISNFFSGLLSLFSFGNDNENKDEDDKGVNNNSNVEDNQKDLQEETEKEIKDDENKNLNVKKEDSSSSKKSSSSSSNNQNKVENKPKPAPEPPKPRVGSNVTLAGSMYFLEDIKNLINNNEEYRGYVKGFNYDCFYINTDKGAEFTLKFDTNTGKVTSVTNGNDCKYEIYFEESLIDDFANDGGFKAGKIKTYLDKTKIPMSMYFKAIKVFTVG